jgi:hypothetical protein
VRGGGETTASLKISQTIGGQTESQGKVKRKSTESKVMVKGKSIEVNSGQLALVRGNCFQALSRRPRVHAATSCSGSGTVGSGTVGSGSGSGTGQGWVGSGTVGSKVSQSKLSQAL